MSFYADWLIVIVMAAAAITVAIDDMENESDDYEFSDMRVVDTLRFLWHLVGASLFVVAVLSVIARIKF